MIYFTCRGYVPMYLRICALLQNYPPLISGRGNYFNVKRKIVNVSGFIISYITFHIINYVALLELHIREVGFLR